MKVAVEIQRLFWYDKDIERVQKDTASTQITKGENTNAAR